MQEIHKTTLLDRLRRAYEAFRGKPVSSLHMGLDIKRCDQCEKEEIVRCVDCRFYQIHDFDAGYCKRFPNESEMFRYPSDYCSKALRRNN